MDKDPQTTPDLKKQPEQERLDRRQFLNGLGKWSMAIIASVTVLRDSHDAKGDATSGVQRGIGSRIEPSQRIARKPHSDHADIPHGERPHVDEALPHHDFWRLQSPPGTKRPPGAAPGGTETEKP